jgi:hypothetical protein
MTPTLGLWQNRKKEIFIKEEGEITTAPDFNY